MNNELLTKIKQLPDMQCIYSGEQYEGSYLCDNEELRIFATDYERLVKAAGDLVKLINVIENLLHGCSDCGHTTLEWGESCCESCGSRYKPTPEQSGCPDCLCEKYEEMCLKCDDGVYEYIQIPHELFETELTALRAELEGK